jgi:hypothetical protein
MKKLLSLSVISLLILVGITQTSCMKDSTTTNPDVTAAADTIAGVLKYKQVVNSVTSIVEWPYGTATIKAYDVGNYTLASATVNADGTFKLVLPATVKGNYFMYLSDVVTAQGGTLAATPDDVKVLGTIQYKVEYTVDGKATTLSVNLYRLNANNTVYRNYYHNFYDQTGTFTGKGTAGSVFNWSFVKGWGVVESYVISSTTGTINSKSIAAVPSGAIWVNGF